MLETIPASVYCAFSFAPGEQPDLAALAAHFCDGGLLINNRGQAPLIHAVPAFVAMIDGAVTSGNLLSIHEQEHRHTVQVFGQVAQIASCYSLNVQSKQGEQTLFGVNLFQLVAQGDRWLISSMCWDDRPDQSLWPQ